MTLNNYNIIQYYNTKIKNYDINSETDQNSINYYRKTIRNCFITFYIIVFFIIVLSCIFLFLFFVDLYAIKHVRKYLSFYPPAN